MPVLGHAFVGLSLGIWTRPTPQGGAVVPSTLTARQVALWTPLVITLSYLPDLLAQLAHVLGAVDARQITHALPSALFMSLAATPILRRIVGISPRRMFVVTFIAIALHDILDVLQATDRMLWWPFSHDVVWLGESIIPTTPRKEAIFFGVPCLLVLVLRYAMFRGKISSNDTQTSSSTSRHEGSRWWLNITVTVLLLGAATFTHQLRQIREDQLEQARQNAQEHHKYEDALRLLDSAERWPSTAKPGRIDYLRAWTYSHLGDRQRTEHYYQHSLRADPNYFWAVADFALFQASAPEGREVRQQRVAPYLHRLQKDFARHPQLPETLTLITQALASAQIESSATRTPRSD